MSDGQKKVLHARVSKDLYEKISSKAHKHRISTSNLIRNIVEDYLDIQGDVFDAVDDKIKKFLDQEGEIVGYQPINLTKDTECRLCQNELTKGTGAFIGYIENSSRSVIVCENCYKHGVEETVK